MLPIPSPANINGWIAFIPLSNPPAFINARMILASMEAKALTSLISSLPPQIDTHYGSYAANAAYLERRQHIANRGPNTNYNTCHRDGAFQSAIARDHNSGGGLRSGRLRNGLGRIRAMKTSGRRAMHKPCGTLNNHTDSAMYFRHGAPDLANVLYCDGHVKSKRISDMI